MRGICGGSTFALRPCGPARSAAPSLPEAPAVEACPRPPDSGQWPGLQATRSCPLCPHPGAGDTGGDKPDLAGVRGTGSQRARASAAWALQATHLFSLGPESPLRPGSSGLPGGERPRVLVPNPALCHSAGALGHVPDSPWVPGGHRGPGLRGDLVHPETQSTMPVSPAPSAAAPHPLAPHPGVTHHWAGDPRRPSGPASRSLGADGA